MFGINRAGIEAWDSSRVSGREKKGAKAWNSWRGEGGRRGWRKGRGKKGGKYPREPSADLCRPWLAGWLAGALYTFIPLCGESAEVRGRLFYLFLSLSLSLSDMHRKLIDDYYVPLRRT